MSDYIIRVENLGKKYKIRHQQPERYVALRDVIASGVKGLGSSVLSGVRSWVPGLESPTGNGNTPYLTPNPQHPVPNPQSSTPNTQHPTPPTEDFWALRDVSFEVKQGEVLGIIGRNGAGKTTLLKIISRITEPTEGRVRIRGRVASLLEVGTGFHPELTGRENIFVNGAILGMTRAEIQKKFDEIVAFAEIEKFLDTPVKRYSSGMYVRLAFAVAAHLDPEILIIDEVLSVGDTEFQKKCLRKMNALTAGNGRTVIFVSHNLVAVSNFCSSAIQLDKGKMKNQGPTRQVIQSYVSSLASATNERKWLDPTLAPGDDSFRLLRAAVVSDEMSECTYFSVETPLRCEFEYLNLAHGSYLSLCVYLLGDDEIPVFITYPVDEPKWFGKPHPKGIYRSSFFIPGNLLNDGTYRLKLLVVHGQNHINLQIEDAVRFSIVDTGLREGYQGKWGGVVRPRLQWVTRYLGDIPMSEQPDIDAKANL